MNPDKNILIRKETTEEEIQLINDKIKNGERVKTIGRNSLGIVIHFDEEINNDKKSNN